MDKLYDRQNLRAMSRRVNRFSTKMHVPAKDTPSGIA